jgi:hypothetical protein
VVLIASTGVYAAIGAAFVLAPHTFAPLVGIELTSITADNDFRAVYGGVPAGLAVFFVMALRRPDWLRPALMVVALTLGGLAASRVWSWLVAGWPEPIGLALHASEILGLGATLLALRRTPDGITARAAA